MDGVVKFETMVKASVCKRFPPVDASYHLKVPLLPLLAERPTVPDPHLKLFVPIGAEGKGLTVIVPVAVMLPQPPVKVTVYPNGLPTAVVGVPLMVATLAAQLPVTPAGSPLKVAPVAPAVVYVILVMA